MEVVNEFLDESKMALKTISLVTEQFAPGYTMILFWPDFCSTKIVATPVDMFWMVLIGETLTFAADKDFNRFWPKESFPIQPTIWTERVEDEGRRRPQAVAWFAPFPPL